MKMILSSCANKTYFHKNGFALNLVLKARYFRTKSKLILTCSSRKRRQNFGVQFGDIELSQTNYLKLAWNAHHNLCL